MLSTIRRRPFTTLVWIVLLVLLGLFVWKTRPGTVVTVGSIPGPPPDAYDYAYGAESLLRGQYSVEWDGTQRTPRYTPGFSILLAPAVALGGVGAADRVPVLLGLMAGVVLVIVAFRLGYPGAAPLAVALVLFAPGPLFLTRLVMTDVPSASLALIEAVLLALGRRAWTAALAGILAGVLVWIRPAALPLLLAGLAAVTGRDRGWSRAAWYLGGAAPLLVLLGGWLGFTYGSPLVTGYQAGGFGAAGGQHLSAFFSIDYVFGPAVSADTAPELGGRDDAPLQSNAVTYARQLLGLDPYLVYPGVGLAGLIGLWRLARSKGAGSAIGRFGLVAVVVTLLVYLPYFYQAARFLMTAAVFLSLGCALLVGEIVKTWQTRRKNSSASSATS